MFRILPLLAIFIFCFFWISCEKQEYIWPDMHKGWMFRGENDSVWRTAKVPGSVQSDLLNHQRIDPPFYRDNEKQIQWIDKQDWVYKKEFQFHREQLNGKQGWIVFEGLDSYARVFLNDSMVWKTENMFVGNAVRVDPFLLNGKNVLRIHFDSPVEATMPYFEQVDYKLPVSANDHDTIGQIPGKRISVFARKAPYQFGWDFALRILTSGIWRPVRFEKRESIHIQDVQVYPQLLSEDSATIAVEVEIQANRSLNDLVLRVEIDNEGKQSFKLNVPEGLSQNRFQFLIDDPEFWWPRGYGDQKMYSIKAQLSFDKRNSKVFRREFGLRDVDLVQSKDSIGRSFYFKVNGTPIFARGANMVPMNSIPSDVTNAELRDLLELATDAHMNMIRVWGGGIYQNDYFYHLCDSLGIMVWQDFMFACSMVPDYPGYFDKVADEIRYNVRRLRNHPSIMNWCGNNEVISAWNNWGWRKRVTETQGTDVAQRIYHTYDSLFHGLIPDILADEDPGRAYWASSPQSAPGVAKSDTSGDRHYWMVWWGKAPFSDYRSNYGRFMSEFGFQSIPSLASLGLFMREADFNLDSDGFSSHQKSAGGNQRLKHYLDYYYTSNTTFDNYPFLTQLLQARAMEEAISTHRIKKPYCMGSLVWQLNDCWPAVSWSMLDFYRKKKAAYFAVKEHFRPVSIFADTTTKPFRLTIVNDDPGTQEVRYKLTIMDFRGNEIFKFNDEVMASHHNNTIIDFDQVSVPEFDYSRVLIYLEYKDNNGWHESILTLVDDNQLELPKSQFTYELKEKGDGAQLEIKVPVFIRSMYVSFSPYDVRFNDNFIDMLPNETYEIDIHTKVDFNLLESSIRFKNVNGILDDISRK